MKNHTTNVKALNYINICPLVFNELKLYYYKFWIVTLTSDPNIQFPGMVYSQIRQFEIHAVDLEMPSLPKNI